MAQQGQVSNIATVNIGDVIKMLVPLFDHSISDQKEIPTIMLWGPPGVGKSDGVEQIANNLREETGKPVHIHDMRLLLFNPVDLRGIPVPNNERTEAIWLRPGILPPAVDSPKYDANAIYIIFLDEITAAPPSVQAAAYQLTLNRRIGEHVLPPNCLMIAAGNRISDKGVAYKMPTPLANRMLHLEIAVDFDSWKDWAIPNGVHQWVLSYLNMHQGSKLYQFDPSSDSVAFPTPRSWMFVSKLLNSFNDDMNGAFRLIAGAIGQGAAIEFQGFVRTAHKIPSIKDIITGKKPPYPDEPDILYALAGALVSHVEKMNKDELKNTMGYLMEMPSKEFGVFIIRDLLRTPGVRARLLQLPMWVQWARDNKNLLTN